MKILLIGPQGSGKSTQGKLLAEHLKVPYISTGDIFRQISVEESDEGKRIKNILVSGQLVDDETTANLLKKRIEESDCQNGFILDGYPRNLEQVKMVSGLSFDKVIYFNLPKQVVIDRLLKRGREDDTESSINIRLDLYDAQTQPLLDYYRDQGLLREVDASGQIQIIQDEIKKFI